MSENDLNSLFAHFMSAIYGRTNLPENLLQASPRLTAQAQLNIYKGSVFGNLTQALADIYPVVLRCVGERFFNGMCSRYIQQHPSVSASLDDYGDSFPNFLSAFEPLKQFDYLPDVARLEWYWHRAFHARDEPVLEASVLQSINPENYERVLLQLTDSLTVLRSDYPLLAIWRANQDGASEERVDLDEGGGFFAVWRWSYDTCIASISAEQAFMIAEIEHGRSLGAIAGTLLSKAGEAQMMSTLGSVFQHGWIVGYRVQSI